MDPGAWRSDKTLFSGMFNPVYLPQLAFRTPLAMTMAGAYGLCVALWATKKGSAERTRAVRAISRWTLAWLVPCVLGGLWYARAVPTAMQANLSVALVTQALERWARSAQWVLGGAGLSIAAIAARGAFRPNARRAWLLVVPAVLSIVLVGTFERVREFVRKPWAIPDYLYSNGFRRDDYAMLQRDGILAHATYTRVRTITSDNEVEAGKEIFTLACTRCHTVDGVNGIRGILAGMYGDEPWLRDGLASYIGSMHSARPFMPPFPGNDREREALAAYLVHLQAHRDVIEGAQVTGVVSPPLPQRPADGTVAGRTP